MTNVSPHGLWLLVDGEEHFLDYDAFPWFREGTIAQVTQVERSHKDHFYWPELDVDLDLDRIIRPERYPLISS
ncbi:MAG: DUF2442 domain-containing protein [Opitutales bacterium]